MFLSEDKAPQNFMVQLFCNDQNWDIPSNWPIAQFQGDPICLKAFWTLRDEPGMLSRKSRDMARYGNGWVERTYLLSFLLAKSPLKTQDFPDPQMQFFRKWCDVGGMQVLLRFPGQGIHLETFSRGPKCRAPHCRCLLQISYPAGPICASTNPYELRLDRQHIPCDPIWHHFLDIMASTWNPLSP